MKFISLGKHFPRVVLLQTLETILIRKIWNPFFYKMLVAFGLKLLITALLKLDLSVSYFTGMSLQLLLFRIKQNQSKHQNGKIKILPISAKQNDYI